MSQLWEQVKKGATTYIDLYNPIKKEGFEGIGGPINSIVWLVMVCFAIYLSWRINGKFDLIHFIFAFCCPPFYIIYAFAITGGQGLFN
jgi:hypothetical protein